MTEPTPTEPQQQGQEPTPPQPDPASQTPPWGSEDQFDPQRAWSLIQNLRGDLDKAKGQVLTDEQRNQLAEYDRLTAEAVRLEEQNKSELQKAQEAAQRTAQERDTAAQEATRYRVALAHGLTDAGDLAMVRGATEDEMVAAAAWIKQKNDAASAAAAASPTPPPAGRTQPVFPGATPPAVPAVADDAYPSSWLSPTQAARIAGAPTTP